MRFDQFHVRRIKRSQATVWHFELILPGFLIELWFADAGVSGAVTEGDIVAGFAASHYDGK